MKKVYCKNCRYFRSYKPFIKIREKCFAPKNLKLSSNYYSIRKEDICYAQDLNENNKCKLYKRKWWKFWIDKMEGK